VLTVHGINIGSLNPGDKKSNAATKIPIDDRHPSKVLYTLSEHFPFAGAFSQKTVNYFWNYMKAAR